MKRHRGSRGWWVMALALTLGVAGMPPGSAAAAAEPLKIGLALPLSGTFADSGGRMRNGFELAREEINAAGGMAGRPIEYVIRDTEGKVNVAAAELRKMVLADKVGVVMGFQNSGVVLGNVDYLMDQKVLTIVTTAASPAITAKVRENKAKYLYLFRVGMNAHQAANLVKPALSGAFFPVKRVYFVAEDTEWGHSLVEGIMKLGVISQQQAAGSSFVSMQQKDFTAVIEDIKAKDPDLVVTAQVGGDSVPFATQFYDAKLRMPLQAIAGILTRTPIAQKMSPKSDFIMYGQATADIPITPKTKPWYKKYQEKFGSPPDAYVDVRSYDAVYMLKQAVDSVGGFDRAKVAAALEKVRWEGAGGAYYFDDSHQVNWPATVVMQHQNKGLSRVIIWPKEHATGQLQRAAWWK
ncbi:MAG: ABC transporter substrate-binding protein [Candidatus Tectomicrobia bacterium]|nr:ABC transporter substrate-binding protein [Candidatus Tectomicrobia bacterium]